MSLWTIRRGLYRTASVLGDLDAARRGPTALLRRESRKFLFQLVFRLWRTLF